MRKHPFTLLELLSVIVIIAVLAGILLGGMNYASRRADEAKTLAIMEEFATALEAFRVDRGYYPLVDPAAAVQISSTGDWSNFYAGNSKNSRPYMEGIQDGDVIRDAYGNAFFYVCPGARNPQKYDLWSRGPDGIDGTDDDICNWKKR